MHHPEEGYKAGQMPVPANPKIYHIVHVDKLASITADGFLYSDALMLQRHRHRHESHQAAAATKAA